MYPSVCLHISSPKLSGRICLFGVGLYTGIISVHSGRIKLLFLLEKLVFLSYQRVRDSYKYACIIRGPYTFLTIFVWRNFLCRTSKHLMIITLNNLLSVIVTTSIRSAIKMKQIMKLRVIDRRTVSTSHTNASSVCKSIFDCATLTCGSLWVLNRETKGQCSVNYTVCV